MVGYGLDEALYSDAEGYWTQQVITQLIAPAAGLYVLYRLGVVPTAYGLANPFRRWRPGKFLAIAVACTLVMSAYVLVYSLLIYVDILSAPDEQTSAEYSGVALSFYHGANAAFFEEIYFRGLLAYLLRFEKSKTRSLLYVVVSAIVFAMSHLDIDAATLVSLLYFGVVAALLYVKVRNIWPLIIAHLIINTALI
jgi:membrane protease YdiL (CAAX protease family)